MSASQLSVHGPSLFSETELYVPEQPPQAVYVKPVKLTHTEKAARNFNISSLFANFAFSDVAEEDDDDFELDFTLGFADHDVLLQEQKEWMPSDDVIVVLHRECLAQNLSFLMSRQSKLSVKKEIGHILQWIFTVDEINGTNVRHIPFSFHNCCMADGYYPDVLRDLMIQTPFIRNLLVELKLYRSFDLPMLRRKFYAKNPFEVFSSDDEVASNGDEVVSNDDEFASNGDEVVSNDLYSVSNAGVSDDGDGDGDGDEAIRIVPERKHRIYQFGW